MMVRCLLSFSKVNLHSFCTQSTSLGSLYRNMAFWEFGFLAKTPCLGPSRYFRLLTVLMAMAVRLYAGAADQLH